MDGFNNWNFDMIQRIKSDMKEKFEIEEETHNNDEEFQWLRTFNWKSIIEAEKIYRNDIENPMLSVKEQEFYPALLAFEQK
jgi:hypothetical protein